MRFDDIDRLSLQTSVHEDCMKARTNRSRHQMAATVESTLPTTAEDVSGFPT
jgi:hypothetical protein